MSPRVVLIGPMGAGKTTVAEELGRLWGVAVRDTDHDVEAAQQRAISDIFVDDGEASFRALERQAVALALAEHDGVLALGGGAVLDLATCTALSGHQVAYLEVGLSEAVKRVGLGVGRPLLLGNVRATIKKLLDERDPIYRSVATIVVNTDGVSAVEVAQRIAAALASNQEAANE